MWRGERRHGRKRCGGREKREEEETWREGGRDGRLDGGVTEREDREGRDNSWRKRWKEREVRIRRRK